MIKFLYVLVLTIFLVPAISGAAVVEFGDDTLYMPSWESGDMNDNGKDTIGTPDFSGGRVTVNDHKITNVQFDYTGKLAQAGDLFIDKDNDGYFDYVLDTSKNKIWGFSGNVLSSQKGVNDELYRMSYNYQQTFSDWRNDHFVAIRPGKIKDLGDDAWGMGKFMKSDEDGIYSFDNLSLEVEDSFNFVFLPTCANDVISAQVVPIPGTLVLLFGGLFGLAGLRKKIQK